VPTFKNFTEIEAWQKARQLTFRVYAVSKHGAFAKDFELRGQMRGASVSVMSNIAEGFDINGTAEFVSSWRSQKAQ
jgi:four helix bundle protein